ncbi:putative odorant receptor 83c [Armigeres subalbatus]|uniref:putative odorant receptor 83c n=1 Tax=Armigeres subalbatus TaxID=124917 RepID=UPI002ED2E864
MAFTGNTLDDFVRILNWQHLILKLMGMDVYAVGHRRICGTYTIVFMAVLFLIISLIDLYLFRYDLFNFSFVLVTIFYALLGVGRLFIMLCRSTDLQQLVLKMIIVYKDSSKNQQERKILRKYTNRLRQCVTLYTLLFMGGTTLAGVLPLIVYWWTGDKILPIGVVIPFLSTDTPDGYQLNYIYQLSCMLWTPPGLIATQNFYFAMSFNICIQYDVMTLKLQTLDKLIAKNVNGILNNDIREELISLIQYQQRLIKFIRDLENVYAIQTFIEVACNAMQIGVTMFVLHIDFWIPGPMMICVSTFQLFLSCMLGTLIDVKNDICIQKIYDVSWHEMPKTEQKTLQFLLAEAQQSKTLSCGGFMPLNMNLFLTVYKKIYSIFMMLQNI